MKITAIPGMMLCYGVLVLIFGMTYVTSSTTVTMTTMKAQTTKNTTTTTSPPSTTKMTKTTMLSTEHTTSSTPPPPTTTSPVTMTTVVKTTEKATTTPATTPTTTTTPATTVPQYPMIVTIGGNLVQLMNNCTLGDASSCPKGFCCTKQLMNYPPSYTGVKVAYQIRCDPLRHSGEFCYYRTPEHFCPCATRCHTNGFYGHCL